MDLSNQDYKSFLAGDPEGLTRIVEDHRDGLMLYLNSFVQNLSVAEDLTEDTFVKLVVKRPHFKSASSFKTWLYTIGRNIAVSYLRRNRSKDIPLENCPELTDEAFDLEQRCIQKEEQRLLHKAMGTLKPEYRQVLWLVYFDGFTHKETARIMGKSVHNVETLVYRARQALKAKLNKEGFVNEKL